MHTSYNIHVEVRGKLLGVSFLLPPCGFQGLSQVINLDDKRLYQLSHLLNPVLTV